VSKKKKYLYVFFGFNMFSMSIIQVLVNVAVPSEDGIVIKWDFKPGSVERSIDVYQRGTTSTAAILSIYATNKNRAIFPVGLKIHRPFFKFDSIKEILEA
jgi:hypothetical protein